jgi:hypothetical protein
MYWCCVCVGHGGAHLVRAWGVHRPGEPRSWCACACACVWCPSCGTGAGAPHVAAGTASPPARGKANSSDVEEGDELEGLPASPVSPAQSRASSPRDGPPLALRLALGAAIAGNILLTNRATVLLSYPIQVLFKSSKLLLAMGVRRCVFGRPNATVDYVAAVLLCAGLAAFMVPSDHAAATAEAVSAPAVAAVSSTSAAAVTAAVMVAGDAARSGPGGGAAAAVGLAADALRAPTPWELVLGVASIAGALFSESAMLNLQEHYFFEKHRMSRVCVCVWAFVCTGSGAVQRLVAWVGLGGPVGGGSLFWLVPFLHTCACLGCLGVRAWGCVLRVGLACGRWPVLRCGSWPTDTCTAPWYRWWWWCCWERYAGCRLLPSALCV